jgi:hypothetical protein
MIFGLPDVLYTDNGSDFTSTHLEQVAADIKIRLIFLDAWTSARPGPDRAFRDPSRNCRSSIGCGRKVCVRSDAPVGWDDDVSGV